MRAFLVIGGLFLLLVSVFAFWPLAIAGALMVLGAACMAPGEKLPTRGHQSARRSDGAQL